MIDEMEFNTFDIFFLYFIDIFFVLVAQDDFNFIPARLAAKIFSQDSSDW